MRLEIARTEKIAAATSNVSRSLGSGTFCGCALERGLAPAEELSANGDGCARLADGGGNSELAGACAKVETDAMPFVERLWLTLEVVDPAVPVVEELLGSLEELEEPCSTDPTESSESAARGLVESNEADVGLLAVGCAVPSAPVAVEPVGPAPAEVEGSEKALEDPAGDEFEAPESEPWVLAEVLPPEAAELYPEDAPEPLDAGAETPGLTLDAAGIEAAVLPVNADCGAEAVGPDAAGIEAAVLLDNADCGAEAVGPDAAGIEAAVLLDNADCGAEAVGPDAAGIEAAEPE